MSPDPSAPVALQLGVLVTYSLALVGFGLWMSRRVEGTSSFFVADRSLSPGLLFSTFLAANIGAGSIIGASSLGYRVGVSAWWFVGSAGIGQLVLAFLIGPRIWRVAKDHGLYTAGDYLEHRYGSAVRATVVSVLWLGTLAILATQLIAMSEILEWVLGAPRWLGASLGAAVMIAYFSAGGLLASAWVNMVQLTVLLTGFLIAIPIAISTAGGWSAVLAAAPRDTEYMNPFAIGGLVWFVALMPAFVVSPGLVQKAFGSSSARAIRLGVGLQAIALLIFASVPVLIGILAHSFDPALVNADFAVPTVLTLGLPALLGALGLAAVFSAEVSSADAVLFMLSTSLSQDIYKRYLAPEATDRQVLRVARIAAVLGGTLGVVLTLTLETVLDSIAIFYAIMSVSLFLPLVAGLYSRRPGVPEAMAAIGAGITGLLAISMTNQFAAPGAVPGWVGTRGVATGVGLAASAVVFALVFAFRGRHKS
jgi:solute:Na+ symporter, SSS family